MIFTFVTDLLLILACKAVHYRSSLLTL